MNKNKQYAIMRDYLGDTYGIEPTDDVVNYFMDIYGSSKPDENLQEKEDAQWYLDNLPTITELQEAMRNNPNIKNSDDYMHIKMAELKPKNDSPTGIANPADYMSIVQEDTDNDGDIDKVSIEEKNEED